MRLKTVILLACLCVLTVGAQTAFAQLGPAIGNITSAGATCSTTSPSTNCVTLKLDGSTGAATILITGTFVGTGQFEVSNDGLSTWTNINCTPPNSTTAASSATSTGSWQCNVAGWEHIRVRASAYTSGTMSVVINGAHASAKSGGGTSLPDLTDVAGVSLTATVPFRQADGAGTAPSYSFTSATTTGMTNSGGQLYLISPSTVNFNAGASTLATLSTTTGYFTRLGSGNVVGTGTPTILGVTSQRAETTTADANVLTVTPAAAIGTYRVSVNISVSSATSGIIAWTLSWTDSNGNAQSNIAMPLFQLGTAAPNTTFTTSAAGDYAGTSTIDINTAAAAIVVKWVGGGTTAAKMSAVIERVQ